MKKTGQEIGRSLSSKHNQKEGMNESKWWGKKVTNRLTCCMCDQ